MSHKMNTVICAWLMVLMLHGVVSLSKPEPKDKSFDVHQRMSQDELKKYFGVSSLLDVPDYDISYPVNADERGHNISKRDAEENTETKYYHMSAFGDKLHMKVSLNNDLLGPNFRVETRHKDGSKTISDAPHRNFYHGHLVSDPKASVAISENRGVSGAIRMNDEEILFVEPLPDHLSTDISKNDDALPHLVTRKSANDFRKSKQELFEREEYPQRHDTMKPELMNENNIYEFDDQLDDKHRFYEVLYAGDHLITEQIGLQELPEMLLIIGNIVARMYTDSSFGDIKLTYVVTKLIIFDNGELNYNRNASNGNKLDAFGKWLLENNPASDADPEHVDTGTLFTSYTGGGLALSGGMCSYRDMKAVVGSIGLSSSAIAAHENFHNLGYVHDGGSDECRNGHYIMSTYVPSGRAAFTWSNCSRRYVQNYLRSKWSDCLRDTPTAKRPSLPPVIRNALPGFVFDGDKQCEWRAAVGAKQCSGSCATLFCAAPGGSCYSTGGPPADGTRCGDEKWCIRGECVHDGSPVVDGGWSSWSDFTQCSRSCGVGIRFRTKSCNNPRPKNGGKPCIGAHKSLGYETCNTHDCPAGSTSFRKLQCLSKGPGKSPFIRSGAECYLWCWAQDGSGYLHGQVVGGTRCYDDLKRTDICVRGECKPLGCDKKLTRAVDDRCGVCDGDGSTCQLQVKKYTRDHNILGNNQADVMINLEKSYRNIHAGMTGETGNLIGIQDKNGAYIINLPSNTRTVHYAGMEIKYIHGNNDEIVISGEVKEKLNLVFIYKGNRNQGVIIRYYTPILNPSKPPQNIFYWQSGNWSACSRTCGQGISSRNSRCLRRDDHSVVGSRFCLNTQKPTSEKSCSIANCPAEWHSYLTPCSKTCGRGIQEKKTICRRMSGEHWNKVDDSECVGPHPATDLPEKHYCNEIACRPEYAAKPWSKCSTTCDEGVMTRQLTCQVINNKGDTITLPMTTCEHHKLAKPMTKQACNYDKPCQAKPQYVGIGCFWDTLAVRTLPHFVANLRPFIDWYNPKATIEHCAKLSRQHQATYFAIQFYGECWASSPNTVPQYDQFGSSSLCHNGLGKSWTNYVYKFI